MGRLFSSKLSVDLYFAFIREIDPATLQLLVDTDMADHP